MITARNAFPFEGRRRQILTVLAGLLALGLIVLVGVRWYAYQWDFHMFYWSAREFAAGRSPYLGKGLSFYHPPLLLYLYGLFTHLPESVACTVWYVLKLAALVALLRIWHRDFVRLRWDVVTITFLALAYNAAIYSDLVAGNVSIFEELLLWLGFSGLLQRRYWLFSLCLIVASQVKLTPLFFVVLLVAAVDKPQWRWLVATLAGFTLVFSLNQVLQPGLFRQFWQVSSKLDERGVDSSSLLALVRDGFDRLNLVDTRVSRLDELLYLLLVSGVGIATLRLLSQYRKAVPAFDQRLLICFACVVFALISPRFKVYTYIILLPPTLYLLPRIDWRRHVPAATMVILMVVLFPHAKSLMPVRVAFDLFITYMPLFAAMLVWSCYALVLRSSIAAVHPSPELSTTAQSQGAA